MDTHTSREQRQKRILIAHQSTIAHYRVPFYEAVERCRPNWWGFSVVLDNKVSKWMDFIAIDQDSVNFDVKPVKTWALPILGKHISLQSFVCSLRKYDLVVIENALNNLSYLFAFFYHYIGKPVVLWGHGKDFSVAKPSGVKKIIEKVKLWMSRQADGFFAYTDEIKQYLIDNGVCAEKIFVLKNTVDINQHRQAFMSIKPKRDELKSKAGLKDKMVLLYVGRLNRGKRLDFLTDAFSLLREQDPSYTLHVVGSGDLTLIEDLRNRHGDDAVYYHGPLTTPEQLAPVYVISDLYIFPGDVGLGPLQALCYDIIPVIIDSRTHKPEYVYLSDRNALILPEHSNPFEYARAIDDLIHDTVRTEILRAQGWPSIKHLTIESMAANFIHGINTVLD